MRVASARADVLEKIGCRWMSGKPEWLWLGCLLSCARAVPVDAPEPQAEARVWDYRVHASAGAADPIEHAPRLPASRAIDHRHRRSRGAGHASELPVRAGELGEIEFARIARRRRARQLTERAQAIASAKVQSAVDGNLAESVSRPPGGPVANCGQTHHHAAAFAEWNST